MPRPKRLKVAASAPNPRASQASQLTVEIAKIHVKLPNVSDANDGVIASDQPVVKKRRGRPPKKKVVPIENASEPAAIISESARVAPEAPVEESLLGDISLESSSPSVETGRRERNSTTFESSSLSIANFRRRPRQPSILGRGPGRARSSSVETNQLDSNDQPSMASRNISALSIGNFRRRARQPSILGQSARSSSVGFDTDRGTPAQLASTLRIGNFKRRARESSILGTGRKPQQDRAADEEEEENDFNPEDESTPLNKSKTVPTATSSSSIPRKRKLSAEKAPTSSSASSRVGAEEQEEPVEAAPLSDEPVEEDDMPSSPPGAPIPSIEAYDPIIMSETMAPPQSSSPPESPTESPPPRLTQRLRSQEHQPRGRRLARGRTPLATQDSPISSPPPLTHSPNRPTRVAVRETPKLRTRRQGAPPSTFSTAQLQTLLPQRRRQPNRDPYEIASSDDEVDISGLASDDDELTNLSVAPQGRRPTANPIIRRPAPLRKNTRSRAPSKSRTDTAPSKATYGSGPNGTSDKENEVYDPDDSLAPLPDDIEGDANAESNQGDVKELKEAVRKFKEVDKWELEFEDVTASSSSPIAAR